MKKLMSAIVMMLVATVALSTTPFAGSPNSAALEAACATAAKAEAVQFRPDGTKMWCAVINREGGSPGDRPLAAAAKS
jgi:hypothetical protein